MPTGPNTIGSALRYTLLAKLQRLEQQRLSGMSVASSIDRPINDQPKALGPPSGSQHTHSHSSGSEEVGCSLSLSLLQVAITQGQ